SQRPSRDCLDVARVREEAEHGAEYGVADAVDGGKHRPGIVRGRRRDGGVAERLHGAEGLGEEGRGGLPDMADAERENEAVEFGAPARVDVSEELVEPLIGALLGAQHLLALLARRFLALARLLLAPLVDGAPHGLALEVQPEDVDGRPEQALFEKELDLLGAQPLDIHRPARDEVLELLDGLGGADKLARAAASGVFLARL